MKQLIEKIKERIELYESNKTYYESYNKNLFELNWVLSELEKLGCEKRLNKIKLSDEIKSIIEEQSKQKTDFADGIVFVCENIISKVKDLESELESK
jgi:hypothetical protein